MENLALHLLILGTVNDTTIARSELLRDTSHVPVPKELTQRLQTLGYASSQEARRQIIQKELYKRGAVWALRDIPSSLFLFLLEETKAGPSPSKESKSFKYELSLKRSLPKAAKNEATQGSGNWGTVGERSL